MRAFYTFMGALLLACGGGGDTTPDGGADAGDAGEGGCQKCVDAPSPGPGTVTVLNAGGTALVSFPADASGDVAPSATISGSQTNLDQASAVAADATGNLYVATSLAILVFPPQATGNVAPARTIAGPTALPTTDDFVSVAVAADGTIYATSEASSGGPVRNPKILVFAPGTNGNVAPTQTIGGPTTSMQSALASALSSTQIVEADATQQLLFFDRTATGDTPPAGTIGTGAGVAAGVAFASTGDILFAQYNFSTSSLLVWAPNGPPTAQPKATVTGTSTKLTAIGGVAAAPDGTIFVSNADPTGPAILVFAGNANGDVAPLRAVSGGATTLSGDASQGPMPLVVY